MKCLWDAAGSVGNPLLELCVWGGTWEGGRIWQSWPFLGHGGLQPEGPYQLTLAPFVILDS